MIIKHYKKNLKGLPSSKEKGSKMSWLGEQTIITLQQGNEGFRQTQYHNWYCRDVLKVRYKILWSNCVCFSISWIHFLFPFWDSIMEIFSKAPLPQLPVGAVIFPTWWDPTSYPRNYRCGLSFPISITFSFHCLPAETVTFIRAFSSLSTNKYKSLTT